MKTSTEGLSVGRNVPPSSQTYRDDNQRVLSLDASLVTSVILLPSNLLFIHVLVVALLHHFPLPALLLQGLLDELGHFALFTRLLSSNHKPAFRDILFHLSQEQKTMTKPYIYAVMLYVYAK